MTQLRFIASVILAACALFSPNKVVAATTVKQYGEVTITRDTTLRRVTGSIAGDGTKITIDSLAGKVYVIEGSTIVAQLDLAQVNLQAANGNPYGSSNFLFLQKDAAGLNPQAKSWPQSFTDPYPCDMSPCGPFDIPASNPYYTPTVLPGEEYGVSGLPDGLGGPNPSPELLALDRFNFNQWRQERCELANGFWSNLGYAAGVGGTLAACLTVETGVGGVACAAGYVALVAAAQEMERAANDCNSEYGGWLNWGND